MAEYPPRVVEGACQRWRRQPGGRRPTPGDIRQMCIEEQRDYPRYYGLDEGQAALPPLAAEERYARDNGWSSAAERRDAIAANKARLARAMTWQREHAAEIAEAMGGKRKRLRPIGEIAAELGVTATEYKPNAEQMRAGRIALGLETEAAAE